MGKLSKCLNVSYDYFHLVLSSKIKIQIFKHKIKMHYSVSSLKLFS